MVLRKLIINYDQIRLDQFWQIRPNQLIFLPKFWLIQHKIKLTLIERISLTLQSDLQLLHQLLLKQKFK